MFGVLIALGLVMIPFLSRSMNLLFGERDVLIQIEATPGTSLLKRTRPPPR